MLMRVASASSIGFPNGSVGSTEKARRARAGGKREVHEGYDGNELTRIIPQKGDRQRLETRLVVNCPPERNLLASSPFMASEVRLPQIKSLLTGYS